MTADEYRNAFDAANPKAIDFPMSDFSTELAEIAQECGYRFAGYRLGRAVFSTKEKKE